MQEVGEEVAGGPGSSAGEDRPAVHDRGCAHQAETTLPDISRMTGHLYGNLVC